METNECCNAQVPYVRSGMREDLQTGLGNIPLVGPNTTREVRINKVANGFILVIGCMTFVAKDWSEIVTGLAEYWENPSAAEKKYAQIGLKIRADYSELLRR